MPLNKKQILFFEETFSDWTENIFRLFGWPSKSCSLVWKHVNTHPTSLYAAQQIQNVLFSFIPDCRWWMSSHITIRLQFYQSQVWSYQGYRPDHLHEVNKRKHYGVVHHIVHSHKPEVTLKLMSSLKVACLATNKFLRSTIIYWRNH